MAHFLSGLPWAPVAPAGCDGLPSLAPERKELRLTIYGTSPGERPCLSLRELEEFSQCLQGAWKGTVTWGIGSAKKPVVTHPRRPWICRVQDRPLRVVGVPSPLPLSTPHTSFSIIISPKLSPSLGQSSNYAFLSPNTESQGTQQRGNRVLHTVSHQIQGFPGPEVHVRGWRSGCVWFLQVILLRSLERSCLWFPAGFCP